MTRGKSLISPEIKEILHREDAPKKLKELFHDMHPYDVFVLCEDLEDNEIAQCIRALGIPLGIELFEEFNEERKEEIFDCFALFLFF